MQPPKKKFVDGPALDRLHKSEVNNPSAFNQEKTWLMDWINHPQTKQRLQQLDPGLMDSASLAEQWSMLTETAEERASHRAARYTTQVAREKVFYPRQDRQYELEDALTSGTDDRFQHDLKEGTYGLHDEWRDFLYVKPEGGYTKPSRDGAPGTYEWERNRKSEGATAVHELTHATDMDAQYNKFIGKKWGLPADPYMQDKEVYPRVMEMRYEHGLKPGQKVTPQMIQQMRKKDKGRLFEFYSDEQVRDMLNTLASNNPSPTAQPMARFGGQLPKAAWGGEEPPFAQQGQRRKQTPMVGYEDQLPELPAFQPPVLAPGAPIPDAEQLGWQPRDMGHVVQDVFPQGEALDLNAQPPSHNFNGTKAAFGALSVMGGLNDMIDRVQNPRNYKELLMRLGRTETRQQPENPQNPFGNYTLNAGPGNNFQPTQHTPTQRLFKEGGEYTLSREEIARLRAQGYEIEEL